MSGDLVRLHPIKNCISDMENMLNGVDEDTFYRNNEKKYATERLLEIIGEAVNKISGETLLKSKNAIPWRDIIDFRNLITHEYFRIDYTMVYKIATEEIPVVKQEVEYLIAELSK